MQIGGVAAQQVNKPAGRTRVTGDTGAEHLRRVVMPRDLSINQNFDRVGLRVVKLQVERVVHGPC